MKPSRKRAHLGFLPFSILGYLVVILGFNALAHISVANKAPSTAVVDVLRHAIESPFASVLLFLPFLGTQVLAVEVAVRSGAKRAVPFFLGVAIAIGWLFYYGYSGAQHALLEQKWTAAALATGMPLILSVLVLIVAGVVAGGLNWRYGRDET